MVHYLSMKHILLGKESSQNLVNTSKQTLRRAGFTIVELLIVVVIIAILATITIVAYNGIRDRASNSAISSAAQQAGKKVLTYGPLNSDTYPSESTYAQDISLPASSAQAAYDYYVSDDKKRFCLSVTDTTKVPEQAYAFTQNGQTVLGRCVKNLVPNPSFEGGFGGWGSNALTPSLSTDWAASGSNSLRQTPNATSSDSFSDIGGGVGALRLGMQPARTYTLTGTIRLTAPQSNGARQVRIYYKTPSTSYSTTQSTSAPNQAGYLRLSTTATLPSDASEAFLRIYNGGSQNAGDTWWDGIMLVQGANSYVYDDPLVDSNWSWTGATNNSASFGPAVQS